MALKQFNPTSPGRRFMTTLDFSDLTAKRPERALTEPLKKSGGRNSKGRITIWFRGGGHKRRYRVIDFRRDKRGIPAKVVSIEYDPNRSARIALLNYADGEKRYILAPEGLKVGQPVLAAETADILPGQRAAAEGDPGRHDDPQHRAAPGQGRADGAQRRRRRPVGGQGVGVRAGQAALGRGAPGARRLHRHHRPGRQHRPQERLVRQGRPQALARQDARTTAASP